jgi:hypothetical protein
MIDLLKNDAWRGSGIIFGSFSRLGRVSEQKSTDLRRPGQDLDILALDW